MLIHRFSAYGCCHRILLATVFCSVSLSAFAQVPLGPQPIVRKIRSSNERLEMVINTSRILTTESKIPQVQVNDREMITLTPLSDTEIQVSAKRAGVTQINLWDEEDNIYTVDVIVFGDTRQLTMVLKTTYPSASLKIIPLPNSVVITGTVDNPDHIRKIIEIAEDFSPKVINNISVGGVHQVLLHIKVMEISRTKLRTLGVDFADAFGSNFVSSGISGLLLGLDTVNNSVATTGGQTFSFGALDSNNQLFGLLEALRQNNMMKILAEPTLQTVSGRPAFFNVGGEFPILVPQSLGTVSIEYKKFGTQIDFVPIVRGNGRIRLEVRPRISEIDSTRSVTINQITVPGLRVREVDTGVEMRAGQTLAIAGLIQNRVESENRGLPWVSELPYIGTLFRRVREVNNEIELLIMVTPQWAEAMDPDEVPDGGPGMSTCSPSDFDLFLKGHIEVPCCEGGRPNLGAWPHVNVDGNIRQQGMIGGQGEQIMPREVYDRIEEVPTVPVPVDIGDPPRPSASVPTQLGSPIKEVSRSTVRMQSPAATPTIRPAPRFRRYNPKSKATLQKGRSARSATTRDRTRQASRPSNKSQTNDKKNRIGFIGPFGYDVKK